jgi:ketosteroid isomerase-like protein
MRLGVTGVAVFGTLAATPLAAQAPDSPAAVVNAFHAAQAAGDSLESLEFLAPDAVIYESGGVEASRDEYRAHHLGIDVAFAAATRREIVDQRVGAAGDVAWVLTQSRVTGRFRERDVDSRGVETMLLRQTPGGWRIVHIDWSSRRGS